MTPKEINEGNIILAEFLGFKKEGILDAYIDPNSILIPGDWQSLYNPDGSDFKFHKDWNALMRVFEAKTGLMPPIEETWRTLVHDIKALKQI